MAKGLFGKGTKSGREEDVQSDSKKAKKEVDELKHSGLSAAAKTILKAAKKAMGTAKVPCRSEEMRATMANLRAGRYGSQPGAAIVEQRVLAMLGEPTMHALFTEFETDEFGGLTTESKPWQIAAAWRLLGDIFVLHWVIVRGATQAGFASLDLDALFQAVTGEDTTTAQSLWDGKQFVNGAASPVTLLVRAALAAAARDVASPRQDVQAPRGGRGAWVPRGGGQLRTPYKRCCQYCRVQLGVVDDSHEQATCPKFAAVIAAKK